MHLGPLGLQLGPLRDQVGLVALDPEQNAPLLGFRLPEALLNKRLFRLQLLPGRRQLGHLLLLGLLLNHQRLFPLRILSREILARQFDPSRLLLVRRLLFGKGAALLIQHRPFYIELFPGLRHHLLSLFGLELGLLFQFRLKLFQTLLLHLEGGIRLRGALLLGLQRHLHPRALRLKFGPLGDQSRLVPLQRL